LRQYKTNTERLRKGAKADGGKKNPNEKRCGVCEQDGCQKKNETQ